MEEHIRKHLLKHCEILCCPTNRCRADQGDKQMPELTTSDIVEECKLEMIADAEREIWELVRPVLEKHVAEYKKDFGKFTRTDACLWSSVGIGIEVAFATADVLEEYNFDIDDAMTDWWIKNRSGA